MQDSRAISKRFAELVEQLKAVEATKKYVKQEYFSGDYVDAEQLLNWKIKALNLLSLSCGLASEHYAAFKKAGEPASYRTNHEEVKELKAIFLAAQEDYDGGFLKSLKRLVQADVYSDEIDQAKGLLKGGYKVAAAVIGGTILETSLRQPLSACLKVMTKKL